MILCDTGPLVAVAVRNDANYYRCTELFTGLRLARRRLLVPMTVIAEVEYMLETRVGSRVEAAEIATLDRRHFSTVRPRHAGSLTLLPE